MFYKFSNWLVVLNKILTNHKLTAMYSWKKSLTPAYQQLHSYPGRQVPLVGNYQIELWSARWQQRGSICARSLWPGGLRFRKIPKNTKNWVIKKTILKHLTWHCFRNSSSISLIWPSTKTCEQRFRMTSGAPRQKVIIRTQQYLPFIITQ